MNASHKPDIVHVYDDIEEGDHHLPNWWLAILWGSLVFGAGYWFYYQVAALGPGSREAWRAEVAEVARRTANARPVTDELLLALTKDPQAVQQGQQQFQQQCAACHGAQGEGKIGPNLTDDYWLHGDKPVDIHKTVTEGVVAKGMPSWGPTLGAERVRAVVAYVLTLKGTHVPGKAPQGELAK